MGRVLHAFSIPAFRAHALGYSDYQWDWYALRTVVPTLVMLSGLAAPATATLPSPSVAIIGIGALGNGYSTHLAARR